MCCREPKENKCKEVPLKITKIDLLATCKISVYDRSELKVSEHLKFDKVEGCDMNNGDKIGRSAIGEIVWTRNKKSINPFPEGVKLIEHFLRNRHKAYQ